MSDEFPAQFAVGDIVSLKSGGPTLTVEKLLLGSERSYAAVAWFHDGTLHIATIELRCLKGLSYPLPIPPKPRTTSELERV